MPSLPTNPERGGRSPRREKAQGKAENLIWKTASKHQSHNFTLKSGAPSSVCEQHIPQRFRGGGENCHLSFAFNSWLKQKQQRDEGESAEGPLCSSSASLPTHVRVGRGADVVPRLSAETRLLGSSGVVTMANEWPRPQGMSLFQAQSCCGLVLETTVRRSTPGVKMA